MKYFENNRRGLTKHHYIRGTEKTVSGTSSVSIEDSAGVPLKRIEIVGKTVQNGVPSKELPVDIQSSNSNGASSILFSKNLATAKQICKGFGLYREENKDGRNCIYYTYNIGKENVIEGGFKENTQYTISFDWITGKDIYGGTGIFTPLLRILYTDGTATALNNNNISNVWKNTTFTTTPGKTVSSIGTLSITNVQIWIDIDTFIIQEGEAISTEYEPYFWDEIPLPTSLEVNGEEIPLILSEYDRLVVDTSKNKVIYHNGGYYKDYYASSDMGSSTNPSKVWAKIPCELTGNGYCSHFDKNSFAFENNLGFGTSGISFPTSVFASTTALGEFLEEQTTNGTPLTILAEKQTPTEYDITSTELGQRLLALFVPKGANGTLELSSAVGITSLDLSYYSETKEDTVKITIKYINEVGEEIATLKEHNVRKASKYLIIAPHIEGYTRVSTEVYGVADEDTTIELLYKEAQ